MSIFQLIYVSSAESDLDQDQLIHILEVSRARNAAVGITGLLLFSEGSIIQLLEGAPDAVRSTFARISRDSRHRGVIRLMERTVEQRDFPTWSMGFNRFGLAQAEKVAPGFSRMVEDAGAREEAIAALSSQVQILFRTFGQTTRLTA